MKDNRTIDKTELCRLLTAYGPLLAIDIAIKGMTEDEARETFSRIMEEENATLMAEQAELKARIDTIRKMRAGDLDFAEGFDQIDRGTAPADSDTVGPPPRPINRLI